MTSQLPLNFRDDIGQCVYKASVFKWHKSEGNLIRPGDDLCDLKIEELLIPAVRKKRISQIRGLSGTPLEIAKFVADDAITRPDPQAEDGERVPIEWVFYLRVTACEEGMLARIFDRKHHHMGEILAEFCERAPEEGTLAPHSLFRVVSSYLEPEPVGYLDEKLRNTELLARPQERQISGPNFLTFWGPELSLQPIGIYMDGSCDLDAVFASMPLIQRCWDGLCAIVHEGSVADVRSDILLQTLHRIPDEIVRPTIDRLRLSADYFRPRLFAKTFTLPGPNGLQEFPKTVVVISTGADLMRTVYRHKQHGFLVDPGGGWLNEPLAGFLNDLSSVIWFRQNFESLGTTSVEQFATNLSEIVTRLRRNVGCHVVVFNNVSLEPQGATHSYQFVKNPQLIRRVEFNIALVELSRRHDFSILDMDRIIKKFGAGGQLDRNHVHPILNPVIGQELVRILKDRDVF